MSEKRKLDLDPFPFSDHVQAVFRDGEHFTSGRSGQRKVGKRSTIYHKGR
jgi:hypothetical protein